jgi:hypothetical protein
VREEQHIHPFCIEKLLRMKDLPNTKKRDIEEYAVTIKAYDQEGLFIGESEGLSATFSLTDGRVLYPEEPFRHGCFK